MKYQERVFMLPANTARISKELWEYRLGVITKEQYHRLVGCWPDDTSPENGRDSAT